MAKTSDFRNGMVIEIDTNLLSIEEFQHVKPGKGNAFVRTKLKNIETGAVISKTFRAGEKIDEARIENHKMQYLYNDGDLYHFMHMVTYEQTALPQHLLERPKEFLKEGMEIEVLFHREKPVNVRLPHALELVITETDPGIKGDTVSSTTKPATLETGAVVQVPLFINRADVIKIDTGTGKYIERVKTA